MAHAGEAATLSYRACLTINLMSNASRRAVTCRRYMILSVTEELINSNKKPSKAYGP